MKLLLGHSGDSLIHRLDPRVKLIWLVGNCSAVFLCNGIIQLSVILIFVALTTLSGRIKLKTFLPLFKISLIIGAQLVLLLGVLRPEGKVIVDAVFVKLYFGGVAAGLQSFLQLLILCCLFLQFVIWTSPEDLTLLSVRLGMPHRYAVLPGLALRFLPVLEKDLRAIFESQQARGLDLSTTRQKIKGLVPVVLPLILKSLKRAKDVSLYMELKGYGRYSNRTFMHALGFNQSDWIGLASVCCYFAILGWWAC
ncbi:MAG: energy-coupling factor transporter transmembrane protein EcfT [Desulfomonile tiedjei]|uniref:Energy-coupling factor transporter transmembrane protein EcfT n=1 Tax=Desulfomonile tiedjei TaxID=2358 RepID=A0A9D6V0E0_9BACT|nr:energy-coupling factor transporter transmembrane protein EcfT [Desulfomonile tiedjei]